MPTDTTAHPMDPAAKRISDTAAQRRLGQRLRLVGLIAAAAAVVVVVVGIVQRSHDNGQTKAWTAAQAIPTVSVVTPVAEGGTQNLILPGTLQAFYNAPIYSRVSGYVHAWNVDIGAPVKTGEVLATIDTPELDQQLEQARADLQTAKANMSLARTTADRWTKLLAKDAVSQQETDEKTGDLAAKTAQVNAAKANVDRLTAMKGFSRIVAPFDGVVTARKTDIGALVTAGSVGGGGATTAELFDVAKIDKLRLYVRVPQSDSARIKPGATASLTVPEYPGRTFQAQLVTTANAVSDASGTLLVELMVDNSGQVLKPGDYAQVEFKLPNEAAGSSVLHVPSGALLFRKSGTEVAVVTPDNHVRIKPVTVGRDLGASIEVTAGLSPTDRVINNPPDSIAGGALVRVVQPQAAGDAHAGE